MNNPYTGVHRSPFPYSPEAQGFSTTGGITDGMVPTVWTDDDKRDPEEAGRMVPLQNLTTSESEFHGVTERLPEDFLHLTTDHMYDTSGTTTERLYDGGVRITPLPSGHRVREITLEVPVSHDKLYDMLFAVDATIDNRRAFGYTIPEESRTVTTIGNEIVIRWEEHS